MYNTCQGRVVTTRLSYSGGPASDFGQQAIDRDRSTVVFLRPLMRSRSLPNHIQVIIQRSIYHLTLISHVHNAINILAFENVLT